MINTGLVADAYQNVKLQQRQLVTDFDQNGVYEPFFVRGVGYAPIPIGKFMGFGDGWSAVCQYAGPFPLQYPALRFEPGSASPDGVYTCGPNGENLYDNVAVLNRDFPLIKDMKANTIRTWSNVTPSFLQKANEHGLKVMAGYWVDHNIDYTFRSPTGAQQRQVIINGFVSYVNAFKNDPAILMWGLSNENNLKFCDPCVHGQSCDRAAQALGYFQLMNDMALAAKQAEGTSFHPVVVIFAELTPEVINFIPNMPAVDIIGINSYRGSSFDGFPVGTPNLFDQFEANFPNKSMIITEFGADAWNSGGDPAHPENGVEDQISQAIYISSAWDEIVQNSTINGGPVNGGVVFHYSDNWNGYSQRPAGADPNDSCVWVSSDWTPSVVTHDYNYTDPTVFGIGIMPDNKVNPEWWGLMSVEQNWNGSACATPAGVDCVYPREVYHALKQKFALPINPTPDLVISALSTATGPVAPKGTLSISSTVKNQGTASSAASVVAFVLSSDAMYGGADDIALTATRSVASLAAGASSAGSTTLTVPAATPYGNYYICAGADKNAAVIESNETNNSRCTATAIQVAPADLIMTAVSGPTSAVTGTSMVIANTVSNQGVAKTGSFTVGLYISSDAAVTTADLRVGTRSVSSLLPGASSSASTAVTLPSSLAAGTYYVGAIADYTNTVTAESNESNNALAGATMTISSGPDLVMTAVSGPASAPRGTSITVSNSILNQGTGTATNSSTVGIYLSTDAVITTADRRIGTRSIPALAVGVTSTASSAVTIPSTLAAGNYYIGVIADYSNTVKESVETNNSRTGNTLLVN